MPDAAETPTRTSRPGMTQIGDVFARYANFTLGGGSATVAPGTARQAAVDQPGRLHPQLCAGPPLTPGTNLLAFCTGIGWLLRRLPGAIVALLAASIPCTAIVVLATALFSRWQENPWAWAQAAIHGAIAAAVAITVKDGLDDCAPTLQAGCASE